MKPRLSTKPKNNTNNKAREKNLFNVALKTLEHERPYNPYYCIETKNERCARKHVKCLERTFHNSLH